ncbi:MAG: tetratricopeptide repeat protein [Phycisphaerae bacterium]
MTTFDPDIVRELFAATMDMTPAEREAELDLRCGTNAALRAEVESLLKRHDQTHGALADGHIGIGLRLARDDAARPKVPIQLPARIGHYRVQDFLGSGGMGIVYLAEQDDPRRTVAVKLMRGDVLTPDLLKRFKREAHVLGQLQHPGIAHIYDAGVTTLDGMERAYFAMEYIDGVPLTEYARRHALTAREKLELIAFVCDAVQHAHKRGIVHRDLKPGNILVDAAGRVRVLDFGVALASHPDLQTMSFQTAAGQIIGTLQYMSPEQACGAADRIDARSDVYALGVIAYELLTGVSPYPVRAESIAEVARTIQEVEPTRVGQFDTRLRGDIEVMLGKALEKDRTRRYTTAADFAADIRRHLTDQPIVARPATTLYRFRKFARRNKAFVAGTTIAFLALAVGLIATSILYVRADRARQLAEKQSEIARRESAITSATNRFVNEDMLSAPNPWTMGGRDVTVASVLDRASATVGERFATAPQVEGAVRTTLGESYAALGLFAEAQPHFDRAAELAIANPEGDWSGRIASLRRRANNLYNLGRFEEARELIDTVLAESAQHAGVESIATAEGLEVRADIEIGRSEYSKAEATIREALRLRRIAVPNGDVETARALNTLGSALHYLGDHAQADKFKLESLAEFRRLLGATHPLVAQVLNDLGTSKVEQGRFEDAIANFEQALPLLLDNLGPEHRAVLSCQRSLGTALSFAGRHTEATPLLERAIADSERTLGHDHPETFAAINCLATSYIRTDRAADGGKLLGELLARAERALGPAHAETIKYRHNFAWCRQYAGELVEAEQLFRRALADAEATLGPFHPETHSVLDALAINMDRQGRYDESVDFLQQLLGWQEQAGGAADMDTARSLDRIGSAWVKAENLGAALTAFQRCVALCSVCVSEWEWRFGIARGKLGETLSQLSEFGAAEEQLLKSLAIAEANCLSSTASVEAGIQRLRAHYDRAGDSESAAAINEKLAALSLSK